MDQNLPNLDLKLLTDFADTTLSGKLFNDGDDDDIVVNLGERLLRDGISNTSEGLQPIAECANAYFRHADQSACKESGSNFQPVRARETAKDARK